MQHVGGGRTAARAQFCVVAMAVSVGIRECISTFSALHGFLSTIVNAEGLFEVFDTAGDGGSTFGTAWWVDFQATVRPFPIEDGHRVATEFRLWTCSEDA